MYYIDSIFVNDKPLSLARWKPIYMESNSLGFFVVNGDKTYIYDDLDNVQYKVWDSESNDYVNMTHDELYMVPNYKVWGSAPPAIRFTANSFVRSLFTQIDWVDFGDLKRILEFFLTKNLDNYKFRVGGSRVVFSRIVTNDSGYIRQDFFGQVFDCAEHFDKQTFKRLLVKSKILNEGSSL